MSKFKLKLNQSPLGGEFVLNGTLFRRGEYCESSQTYKCMCMQSDLVVYLHKFSNVEPKQSV